MLVEELSELGGDLVLGTFAVCVCLLAEVTREPGSDDREERLGLERVPRIAQGTMELEDATNHRRIRDLWPIDGRPDRALRQHVGAHVQDPLAVAVDAAGAAVVHDMRREDRDASAGHTVVPRL